MDALMLLLVYTYMPWKSKFKHELLLLDVTIICTHFIVEDHTYYHLKR
jgi:hypothetical protein